MKNVKFACLNTFLSGSNKSFEIKKEGKYTMKGMWEQNYSKNQRVNDLRANSQGILGMT